ncbi:hypothetical protein [Nonomuraea sp. NPDC050643]|uniref:hypothetical protein n=1 Tax=Nonomuraea sp. NPDC050643 TaxID=3155660 RepID=UPI0033F0A9C5
MGSELVTVAESAWWDRYDAHTEEFRMPKQMATRVELANQIGADGTRLLLAVYSDSAPPWLREVPAVEMLRRIWLQEFRDEEGQVRWRTSQEQPASSVRLVSPYDEDARVGVKRETQWDGFKVHLTETCDDDGPHLITDVATTSACCPWSLYRQWMRENTEPIAEWAVGHEPQIEGHRLASC